MKVEDLDILRPEPRFIHLGGKDIDVSFIPCGITFEVDEIVRKMSGMDEAELLKGGEKAREAFNLSIRLCSTFCSHTHPELDEDWCKRNLDAIQINIFTNAIKEALIKAYAGIGSSKNQMTSKEKEKKK